MTRNRPNIGDWRWFDNNMCAGDKFQTSLRGNHDTNKGHECQPLQQGLKKSENPGCFAMSRLSRRTQILNLWSQGTPSSFPSSPGAQAGLLLG